MKPSFFIKVTQGTKGSGAAKRIAEELSKRVGKKIWRSTKTIPNKEAIKYGPGVDKLTQYKWFKDQGLSTLEYTTEKATVLEWLKKEQTVFGRKLLNGSCGQGIVVIENEGAYENCPVFTLYKKKKREFRVHLFRGILVAIVEKKRRKEWDGKSDAKIRNLENGYVFCQTDPATLPKGIQELATKASKVTSSDFAGVDIGYNEKLDELFVIEVNSSPGVEGTNVERYCDVILKEMQK